ncbi:unnamed protein product [Blepharisma stoltei]|uniref:Phosphatidic acid phosphatase type 2/haloperoxidase domain-containing protein n=1 Tax=Blepharisma stoltei TaxID=1481888 RepID=A0AAU9JX60_9CILI|nr:unnamed protein product [Blepharisma stoltei]
MILQNILPAVLCVLALICCIIEATLTEKLQNSGADFTTLIQSNNRSSTNEIFKIISTYSMYILLISGMFCYTSIDHKIGTFAIISEVLALWMSDIMKMHYSHPRPFWWNSDVEGIICGRGWGAPSGHALMVAAVVGYFAGEFVKNNKEKALAVSIGAIIIVLVDFDRVYVGVHFYFQVIHGNIMGFCIAFLLLNDKIRGYIKRSFGDKKFVLIVNFVFGILWMWGILLYLYRDPDWDKDWSNNFSSDCSGDLTKTDSMREACRESTFILFLAGFWVGKHFLTQIPASYTWKTFIYGTLFFIPALIIDQCLEYLTKTYGDFLTTFICFSIIRFISGFVISFVIPLIVFKIINWKKIDYERTLNNPNNFSERYV